MQQTRSRCSDARQSGAINLRALLVVLGAFCVLGGSGGAYGAAPKGPGPFQICPRNASDTDAYALCATAQCFFLNNVAYCKCDLMNGSSISAKFEFEEGSTSKNVCDLLDQGASNGFTVSTYSTPVELTKSYAQDYDGAGPPPLALYTCPAGSSGAYAQCDGGICFSSSTGTDFPGVGPVGSNQIVCACPITEPRKTLRGQRPRLGFQIAGPWQKTDGSSCKGTDSANECCSSGPEWPQGDWFAQFCFPSERRPSTGDVLTVGAPQGTAKILSLLLDGPPAPQVNECSITNGRARK